MKRKDLEDLGLEKEVVDKIMGWNGTDIEAEKAKIKAAEGERDNYKSQLDTATEELDKFKDLKPEEMQATITKLQHTLKVAIKAAGGRNEKAVMALLDIDILKESKDQSADIKKALDAAKESDSYLFGSDEPCFHPVGPTNDKGGNSNDMGSLASIRAAMGLPTAKKGE